MVIQEITRTQAIQIAGSYQALLQLVLAYGDNQATPLVFTGAMLVIDNVERSTSREAGCYPYSAKFFLSGYHPHGHDVNHVMEMLDKGERFLLQTHRHSDGERRLE